MNLGAKASSSAVIPCLAYSSCSIMMVLCEKTANSNRHRLISGRPSGPVEQDTSQEGGKDSPVRCNVYTKSHDPPAGPPVRYLPQR
eukprot:379746-Amorphochlora_amoeboformis.AAC.2